MRPRADDLVELTTRTNELEAGLIQGVLDAAGIESWPFASEGVAVGIFGASTFNPTTVKVRRIDVERAREALAENREDSVDLDWSEVDVGEPVDEAAARIARRDDARPRAERLPLGAAAVIVTLTAVAGLLVGRAGALFVLVFAGVYVVRRAMLRRNRGRRD